MLDVIDVMLGDLAWWRGLRGGHWELVDFDVLLNAGGLEGHHWVRRDVCGEVAMAFRPRSLVRCEDHS